MRPDEETARSLGALVDTCLLMLPGHGPRQAKVASTAVHALARIGDRTAVRQLRALAERTRYGHTLRVIGTALS